MNMTRREAIIHMAMLMGSSVVGSRLLARNFGLSGEHDTIFSANEVALLNLMGDTILPETDVPGAGAVEIGTFVTMMLSDCYAPEVQSKFREDVRDWEARYQSAHGQAFMEGSPADRTEFLNQLDHEQYDSAEHSFRILKDLTILGYFTSEIGCTQALRFKEVPGSYDGNVPYRKGDRAWFTKIR